MLLVLFTRPGWHRRSPAMIPRVTTLLVVFRIYGRDGALETSHPHVVILVSGVPFFVAHEALEGFPY